MPKKKTWMVILLIVVVAVLTIGVPFAINEAYKVDNGYVTMWGAEDVLSYYGAILGATATIAALALTIWFTKKQIQRDAYLKNETDKWRQVESTIGSILNEINPMIMLKRGMDTEFIDPGYAMNQFSKYSMDCRLTTDQLMTRVNTFDFKMISELVKRIQEVADKLFQLSQKEIDQHNKRLQLQQRENALKFLTIEQKCPGSFPASEVAMHQKTIRMTDGICLEEITDSINEINKEFWNIYDTEFRPLLQLKGTTFESIYMQIQANADVILSFWRK